MTESAFPSRDVQSLSNVGPAVRRYFEHVGITGVEQLVGRDPFEIYEAMCAVDGQILDLCLLDTVISAVDQAGGQPARPWWHYTPERKRWIADRKRQTASSTSARTLRRAL